MKRMEQMKFMVELDWKMRFEKLDKIFHRPEFLMEFTRFLNTEYGKKWINSENGKRFTQWQES